MDTKGVGGRPPDSFLDVHFTKKEQVQNKSRRWLFTCRYCNISLQHRDNVLLNHLGNGPNPCPSCPTEVRQNALLKLCAKGGINVLTKHANALLESLGENTASRPPDIIEVSTEASNTTEASSTATAEMATVVTKKRKFEGSMATITRFLDKKLTKNEVEELNLRLLRCVALVNTH